MKTPRSVSRVIEDKKIGIMDTITFIMNGNVISKLNNPISNCSVLLSNRDTTYSIITNVQGKFSFTHYPAGSYYLKIIKKGYAPLEKYKLDLGTGEIRKITVEFNEK
jgi:hypothetical protein